MKHYTVDNLKNIENEVELKQSKAKIIAVSKTFPIEKIMPLIKYGHQHFGENKVQEAKEKWTKVKLEFKEIKLHLVGKLQTNKVKFVLPLFDYIHSLDNIKLAEKISEEQIKKNFKPKIFIQVNIGEEKQKNGILKEELENFIKLCKNSLNLNIIGLMCLPPNDGKHDLYFKEMQKLCKEFELEELSMGMSNDYKNAITHESTFLRIGSNIFGQRI